MYRPFYALIVLLEALAGSLLLVKSAHSQTESLAIDRCQARWIVYAFPLDEPDNGAQDPDARLAESQSQDATMQGGAYDPFDAAQGRDSLTWQLAEDGCCFSPALIGTGYDGDYDSAMFEGEQLGMDPSVEDVAASRDEAEWGEDFVQVFSFSGPGTSLQVNPCGGVAGREYGLPFPACPWDGDDARTDNAVVAGGEAEGLVEAPASEADHARQAFEACETIELLCVVARRAADLAGVLWHGARKPFVMPRDTSPPPAPPRRERALLQTANALDHLGLQLQDQARQLRLLAAECNVPRGEPPHVARLSESP